MSPSVSKCVRVTLDADGRRATGLVELQWFVEDPCAVVVTFDEQHANMQWMLGRELLKSGCFAAVGDGDARVRPAPNNRVWVVEVELQERVVVGFSRPELMRFLECTECLVRVGDEVIPVDDWLSSVLDAA